MDTIASRRNPFVSRCRRLRAGRSADDPALLLDGWHLVRDALRAGLKIEMIAISASALDSPNDEASAVLDAARFGNVRVTPVEKTVMEAISPVRAPTGVVAIAAPPQITLESVVRPSPALVVVPVAVQEPGNLGAIVRVVEAAGGTGVIAAGESADPFGWKALRGSMGSALRLPVGREPDTAQAVADLKSHGAFILATAARASATLYDQDLRGEVAILVGGEGGGLPREVADLADGQIAIPMATAIESLNVATATAVIVYEAWRQRHRKSFG